MQKFRKSLFFCLASHDGKHGFKGGPEDYYGDSG